MKEIPDAIYVNEYVNYIASIHYMNREDAIKAGGNSAINILKYVLIKEEIKENTEEVKEEQPVNESTA